MFGELSASHRVNPALLYGESVLASAYEITAAVGTFVDVGLHLSLPSAGTYLIGMNIRTRVSLNAASISGYISSKLYRSDTGGFVANSERFCIIFDTSGGATFVNVSTQNESGYTIPISVNAACYVALYAKRDGVATAGQYASSHLESDDNGYTSLNYIKIG